jgi:hypothetical protein
MQKFLKVLTGMVFTWLIILNSADATITSIDMKITGLNYDESNNLIVEGQKYIHRAINDEDYTSGFFIRLIIKDQNTQYYVYNSWKEFSQATVLLNGEISSNSNRFTFGEGFIPVTSTLSMFPIEYEMQYYHLSDPSG